MTTYLWYHQELMLKYMRALIYNLMNVILRRPTETFRKIIGKWLKLLLHMKNIYQQEIIINLYSIVLEEIGFM